MLHHIFGLDVGDGAGFRNAQNSARHAFFEPGFHRQNPLIFNDGFTDVFQKLGIGSEAAVEIFINGFSGMLNFIA